MSKEQQINFDSRKECPDCKERKDLITHHIITQNLADYLVRVGSYYKGDVGSLRMNLKVKICKECEDKFHDRFPEVEILK